MNQLNYRLPIVRESKDLESMVVAAFGFMKILDGEPDIKATEVIDVIFSYINDTSEVADDFDEEDWDRSHDELNKLISLLREDSWYVYAGIIEASVINPFTNKSDSLSTLVLAFSKSELNQLEVTKDLVDSAT